MTRMSNARARFASSRPIRPYPTMPSVFPASSPISIRYIGSFDHSPLRTIASPAKTFRDATPASSSASSATVCDSAPLDATVHTGTPAAAHAAMSTWSNPCPGTWTSRSFAARASNDPSTVCDAAAMTNSASAATSSGTSS